MPLLRVHHPSQTFHGSCAIDYILKRRVYVNERDVEFLSASLFQSLETMLYYIPGLALSVQYQNFHIVDMVSCETSFA